jgi:glutamyl-tRNA synthetase
VHLSVFLNPSGKGKMSKRHAVDPKSGITTIYALDMKALGYLPEAVVNWLALMGWSYDDHTERFTLEELIQRFSLARLTPSPAAVNFGKLDHFNGVYIRSLTHDELATRVRPFFEAEGLSVDESRLRQIVPLIQERIHTLDESVEMAGFFFRDHVEPDPALLVGKDMTLGASAEAAAEAFRCVETLPDLENDRLDSALRATAQRLSLSAGQFFGILRMAVTGQAVSPPLIETMGILGKEVVLERIRRATELLRTEKP